MQCKEGVSPPFRWLARSPSLAFAAMHSLVVLTSVFAVIFVAELPDKTALTTFVMATRHKAVPVFTGAAFALAIQSLVAVLAGELLSKLPARPVHVGAGLLFLVTAVLMWRQAGESEVAESDAPAAGFWRTAWVVFGVVFLAEWGDLTQLATAALAARYRAPFTVFVGATGALWAVVAIATFVGSHAGKLLPARATKRVAAGIFCAVGIAFVTGVL
jgi:putative Ca2+/H+ antiporter (TMEM165/GDT1 family)